LQSKNSISTLQEMWEDLPAAVKKRSSMVAAYVEQLLRFNADSIAANLLRKQLQKDWDDELVRLYGLVAGEDVDRQLVFSEDWLRQRPADANLMLTAARLSLRNQLWGKAKEYLESSLRQKNTPEACAELGRLLAHLGEHEKSTHYYQQGLLSMTKPLPNLPMPKS
jgi:HemY protein